MEKQIIEILEDCKNGVSVEVCYDALLNLLKVSQSLMNKRWAEDRERTAQIREQVAIEKFIEIYWDEEYTPTFEEINKRLKLH